MAQSLLMYTPNFGEQIEKCRWFWPSGVHCAVNTVLEKPHVEKLERIKGVNFDVVNFGHCFKRANGEFVPVEDFLIEPCKGGGYFVEC